jgi:hypothetical protein
MGVYLVGSGGSAYRECILGNVRKESFRRVDLNRGETTHVRVCEAAARVR